MTTKESGGAPLGWRVPLQPGPLADTGCSIALSSNSSIAAAVSPRRRAPVRFETISEHIHLSAGLVFENGLRIYDHALSDNPLSFHILGIYLPDE